MSGAVSGLALASSIPQLLNYDGQVVTAAWKLHESVVNAVEGTTLRFVLFESAGFGEGLCRTNS